MGCVESFKNEILELACFGKIKDHSDYLRLSTGMHHGVLSLFKYCTWVCRNHNYSYSVHKFQVTQKTVLNSFVKFD